MAGNYPDLISNRMAYHIDGSQGFAFKEGSSIATLSAGNLTVLNDETNNSVDMVAAAGGSFASSSPRIVGGILFPEERTLSGFFTSNALSGVGSYTTAEFQTSSDTTNGIDGFWITHVSGIPSQALVVPNYRETAWLNDITDIPSVRGVRLRFGKSGSSQSISWALQSLHLFGRITATANRLEIWHPTLDQRIDPGSLDWGNAARSTQDTRTFRVKNLSATQTANSITVSIIDSTDPSPSYTDTMDLNQGAGYAVTQNIGNLSPGATSGVLTVRRTFGSTQPLGVWAAILKAEAGSWT